MTPMNGSVSGDGLLVLIVGASGTGKDSLLREIERVQQPDSPIRIMRRHITRAPEPSEHHIPLSVERFTALRHAGAFSLHWQAHGLSYGVGRELEVGLAEGRCCLASVSRTVVADARRRFPRTLVVEVVVSEAVREQRLLRRGREGQVDVQRRLARRINGSTFYAPDLLLDNSGPIGIAAITLLTVLSERVAWRGAKP